MESEAGVAVTDSSKDKPFRLLDLPPELWSRICKDAVVSDELVILDGEGSSKSICRLTEQPAIIRTCNAIRNEARPTFYGTNAFILVDNAIRPNAICRWLSAIGPVNRRSFARLYVASEAIEYGTPYFGNPKFLSKYGSTLERRALAAWENRDVVLYSDYPKTFRVTLME